MIVASFVSTKHRNMTEDRRTDTPVAITAVALQAVRTRCKNAGQTANNDKKQRCTGAVGSVKKCIDVERQWSSDCNTVGHDKSDWTTH